VVTLQAEFVGVAFKTKYCRHDWLEPSIVGEFAKLGQMVASWFDNKIDCPSASARALSREGFSTMETTRFSTFHQRASVSPSIQHQIYVVDKRIEGLIRVIDDAIGTELLDESCVQCGGSRYRLGSEVFGELNREASYAARTAVNQHSLAREQRAVDMQCLLGRKRRQRNRHGFA